MLRFGTWILSFGTSLLRLSWTVPCVLLRDTADSLLPLQHRASSTPPDLPRHPSTITNFLIPPEHAGPLSQQMQGPKTSPVGQQPFRQDQLPTVTNPVKKMSTQFYDSNVSTVDYQILFTKRDYEAILEKGTTAVARAMTGSGFASWKIAEFIRTTDLHGMDPPKEWKLEDREKLTEHVGDRNGKRKLRSEYLEFLQVEYQVLSTLDRKPVEYAKDQVQAIREIAATLNRRPSDDDGSGDDDRSSYEPVLGGPSKSEFEDLRNHVEKLRELLKQKGWTVG
jgi:hypothetical protein